MIDLSFPNPRYMGYNSPMKQLSYEQILKQLQQHLENVLSSRRTAQALAAKICTLEAKEIEFCLKWIEITSRSNNELAYQYASLAPLAVRLMDEQGNKQWLLEALQVYDREGLYPASRHLNQLETFAAQYRLSHVSMQLKEVQPLLEKILRGLEGRKLDIAPADSAWTDTETIFLPTQLNYFASKQQNQDLYKFMAVHLWAQNRYGTFKRPHINAPHLYERIADIGDDPYIAQLFEQLETIRLNACIERDFPGLARQIHAVSPDLESLDNTFAHIFAKLQDASADVETTLQYTQTLWKNAQLLKQLEFIYAGELHLEEAAQVTNRRLDGQQDLLKDLFNQQQSSADSADNESGKINQDSSGDMSDAALEALEELMQSATMDLTELPHDWQKQLEALSQKKKSNNEPSQEQNNETALKAMHTYDEWDFQREHYRQDWCSLIEKTGEHLEDDFVNITREKYHYLIQQIRRQFELLRASPMRLRARKQGDEIDLDAAIRALCDYRLGGEMDNRVYIENKHDQRQIAVMFMLDMSGSTKGWINLAIRESLVLLVEALETLGDQYAIYGFSGMTRNRCEVYKIKEFEQDYNQQVQAAISGIRPKDYTRMGVAIRHLGQKLLKTTAKTHLLITLSDGRPDDYDGYHGEYGIADTQKALQECANQGVHSFCITVDKDAPEYLPRMYNNAHYAVIDKVEKLPLKVTDIYRKITT